jgi:pimeloyl-ACP methyl ester carboxylesterase
MFSGIRIKTTNMLAGVFLVVLMLSSFTSASALETETISRRDLVIDLGEGLTTDAQLTFPAVGDGPFPGVLLIAGSGSVDMNEFIPAPFTGTGKPSRPMLQVAECLSARGYAVLRYNKRYVGLNGTILNPEITRMPEVQVFIDDAEKALEVLAGQPEVDADDLTLLGHSEGAIIALRLAIGETNVRNVVLWAAIAEDAHELLLWQLVSQKIEYAEAELDGDRDGLLSVAEVEAKMEGLAMVPLVSPLPPQGVIYSAGGAYDWYPGLDADGDGYLSIHGELEPLLLQQLELYVSPDPESPYYDPWIQSHLELDSNLAVVGNVTAAILILQGEGDTQTPYESGFLLEQRLTEVGHPDHTLITYPGLGHTLYPVEGMLQPMGPVQEYVLSDFASWLKDPARKVRNLDSQLQTAEYILEELRGQLGDLNSELDQQTSELENQVTELQSESTDMQNAVAELERHNLELQSALDSARNMTYIALGVALIAAISGAVIMFQNRNRS